MKESYEETGFTAGGSDGKEYNQLKADFSGLDSLIEQLSAYIQSTGKKGADHAATLRTWAKRQKAEQKSKPGIRTTPSRKEKAHKDDRENFRTVRFQYSRKCRRLLWHGWIAVLRKMSYAKGKRSSQKALPLMGKNKHLIECSCQRTERVKQEALISQQKHLDRVRRLKTEGFF